MSKAHTILSRARIPVPPLRLMIVVWSQKSIEYSSLCLAASLHYTVDTV